MTKLEVAPQPTTRASKPASSLAEKVFLPAFLPPYIARDTERYQVTDNIWCVLCDVPPQSLRGKGGLQLFLLGL